MPARSYKERDEIKTKIISYLREPSEPPKSWKELKKKARSDKISPTTLSRYLKEFERLGLVRRSVDPKSYPPRVLYEHSLPQMPSVLEESEAVSPPEQREHIPDSLREEMERIKGETQRLDSNLMMYEELLKKGAGRPLLSRYFAKFEQYLVDLVLVHVWASKFPAEEADLAMDFIQEASWQKLIVDCGLGMEAPILIEHRESFQKAAEDYLLHFLANREPAIHSREEWAKILRPYLEFKPNIVRREPKKEAT